MIQVSLYTFVRHVSFNTTIDHSFNLRTKHVHHEGLRHDLHAGVELPIIEDCIFRITGDKQHF